MIRVLLATCALLAFVSGVSGAQRIVGYQVGIVHVMDTDDCPAPKITSYALSDAVLERMADTEALTVLYSEAIWWARSYCGTYNNEALRLRIELRIAGEVAASLSLTDREYDSDGGALWWAERLTVSDFSGSDIEVGKGPVQEYLSLLADSLLERERTKRENAAKALLGSDFELLGQSMNPTIAFSVARLTSPSIGGDVDKIVGNMALGTLYLEEQRETCPEDPSAMQRAADIGSPIAAFMIARCAVNLHALSLGKDLKATIESEHAKTDSQYSRDEAYDRFMFHMAKALVGGYAPAYGVIEELEAYTDEFVRYAKLLGQGGEEKSIAELLTTGGGGAAASVSGLPGKPEAHQALNEQILFPNCSRIGVILATGNPAAGLFSNIQANDGWCVTDNLGARINVRFGKIRTLDCQTGAGGMFDCTVSYDIDCRIDSFESTAAGNRLICGALTAVPAEGRMQAVRRSDGVLVIERFRANGNERFVQGRAPALVATADNTDDTAASTVTSTDDAVAPTNMSASQIIKTIESQRARIVADGETPYILVDLESGRSTVPSELSKDGKVILDISPAAVEQFKVSGYRLIFSVAVSDESVDIVVIGSDVIAVYAKETGQGILFRE